MNKFNGDGKSFILTSEAYRISLAHLFDPLMAVHNSLVEPLPHQILAVYQEMLSKVPLRFLLADDPGAGKTIMAGLLISELLIRGDLQRCLIVCPGSLARQWQEELQDKFHLSFAVFNKEYTSFNQSSLLIARLDHLARNPVLQEKLERSEWDLIICDEAHKMSASFYGNELKETKRYKLGKLLSKITRHFLLMSATPHNGKEEDFQLLLSLIDPDRFEGKFRDGVHVADTSNLMRRMVKEELLKFDGKPLFPERIAYTVNYPLSESEAILYQRVTEYVQAEFNRADALDNNGRRGTVGFALTLLQRRLASSPAAIYNSLCRRRERLEMKLSEQQSYKSQKSLDFNFLVGIELEDLEDDFEDLEEIEKESKEEEIIDLATASRTIAELKMEIETLKTLESLANSLRLSGKDRKWEEFSCLLQEQQNLKRGKNQAKPKIVVFSEHRDTLNYLQERITTLLGKPEAVVVIHGGQSRQERKRAEETFKQDLEIEILLATDAAGEGINLQRAYLMINYDLPWNPNRLEQRFGRIHRIGQTQVCHLWNLVAGETREGDVYRTLLNKLEIEQKALGGRVFDVLGKAIAAKELKGLMLEAIRYGDRPEVKARLNQVINNQLNQEHLRELLEERLLAKDSLDISKVQHIGQEIERAQARRLQPHFIASFFLNAFEHLGGTIRARENKRYEITHVPSQIRNSNSSLTSAEPILRRYERVCFDKDLINVASKPLATFITPGHPLLRSTIALLLEDGRNLLKEGSILLNTQDPQKQIRVLFYLEHTISTATLNKLAKNQIISQKVHFLEITLDGEVRVAGYAPYLDYRPLETTEITLVQPTIDSLKLSKTIEEQVINYSLSQIVPEHLQEIKSSRYELIEKTSQAVKDRLSKEINYWDHRASELRAKEERGQSPRGLNSTKARARADELAIRLKKRLNELELQGTLINGVPLVVGKALIVPAGLLANLSNDSHNIKEVSTFARNTKRIELLAMQTVMAAEKALGHIPIDVSAQKCGYDIESMVPATGKLRFIEVKGRIEGADTLTVTKNEILTALNKPDGYILALVKVTDLENNTQNCHLRYLSQPFSSEPDAGACSVNYDWHDFWQRGIQP